uniref:Uncharacterized protein n=1 Tax=Timema cristinae TaxID=61476 RepID=A0A7R9D8I9_TIMCR|nr:unnamed protein product [Timema cristinae]
MPKIPPIEKHKADLDDQSVLDFPLYWLHKAQARFQKQFLLKIGWLSSTDNIRRAQIICKAGGIASRRNPHHNQDLISYSPGTVPKIRFKRSNFLLRGEGDKLPLILLSIPSSLFFTSSAKSRDQGREGGTPKEEVERKPDILKEAANIFTL